MARRPRRRYSRRQIVRNRVIVIFCVLVLLALLGFGIWAVVRWAGNREPDFTSQLPSREEEALPEEEPSDSPEPPDAQEPEDPPAPEAPDEEAQTQEDTLSQESLEEQSPSSEQETPPQKAADPNDPYYEEELPLLVGPNNPIPDDFVPDVADLGNGYQFDVHATAALQDMINAAAQDGISLWLLSAYRSTESQTRLFNEKVAEYESYGYDAEEAYVQASAWVAVPGTSEHSLGLSVDLNSLEESFEDTQAFQWLITHCADYGFILRYPKDKVEITGISYEPWHYRYVGSNHAHAIMEQGICLEEYLGAA